MPSLPRQRIFGVVVLGLSAAPAAHAQSGETLRATETDLRSDDGVVHLRWRGDVEGPFELQHRHDERGGATKTVATMIGVTNVYRSGLAPGRHEFRLRPEGAQTWSEPITASVAHPDANLVRGLMALGCLTFLATGFAVWRGHRRTRQREAQAS